MARVYDILGRDRGLRRDRAHHRRERHRQGARRARRCTTRSRARDRAVRGHQLRGDAGVAARERAVRPRAGRLHRRPGGARRAVRCRRTAARCFLDEIGEHAARRCSRSCCARSRSGRVRPVGRRRGGALRRAHRRRHQPRSRGRGRGAPLPRGPLLPDQRRSTSSCRRCARAATTCCSSRSTSSSSSPRRAEQAGDAASSRAAAEQLLAYAWPGNVRELQNCIERAVALTQLRADRGRRSARDGPRLPAGSHVLVAGDDPPELVSAGGGRAPLHPARARGRRRQQDDWPPRSSGVDRKTLYRKLEEYGAEEGAAGA